VPPDRLDREALRRLADSRRPPAVDTTDSSDTSGSAGTG
jgi:hypothetical protein